MTHSDKYFHMRSIGASEYHFGEYKHIRMDSNGKNEFSGIFGFPPKNFGGPYLGSPTWHRGHSVLKIIVWRSSVPTNIFQALGKPNKASRASEVSRILNFENFKIFDLAYFCGSGALIMLPQGQEDVCVQRGTPDDDFEY